MLLVKHQQVSFCQVVRRNGIESEIVPGLIYQNNLFVRGKSYPKHRRNAANEYIRHNYLEKQNEIASLLLESDRELTIYYHDNQGILAIDSEADSIANVEPVDSINLSYVIAEMRGIGGIKIKDRRYKLRIYPRCFIGSEAIDWMRDRFRISRNEAVKLGQRLMDAKYIHHVVDDREFNDGYFFYRFYWDEDN